jgi:hypothetical protein
MQALVPVAYDRPVAVKARRTIGSAWRIVAALLVLFAAYVCGRGAGILLGIGPYLTEIAAIAIAIGVVVRLRPAARRRSLRRCG